MPTAVVPIISPVASIVPTPVPVAIMAMTMARCHDYDGSRLVHGRPPHDRPGMDRPRHDNHRGVHRPRYHDHGRRTHRHNGHNRRADHPRRRREAEGDAEVEVRPRRGGDCIPEGEGTDSDYGFGFHNARFDGAPLPRFENRPSIELIAGLSPARSTPGRVLAGMMELEDVGTDADPVAGSEPNLHLDPRVVQERAIGGVQIEQPVLARFIGANDGVPL